MRQLLRSLKRLVAGVLTGIGTAATAGTFPFTPIDVPGATDTRAEGIKSAGQIVGEFFDSAGVHGFLYASGRFTTIDVPGANFTVAMSINDAGQIVGWTGDPQKERPHGFLYAGGKFIPIDVPGASETFAGGINNAGQIVGFFSDAAGSHGFLDVGWQVHHN